MSDVIYKILLIEDDAEDAFYLKELLAEDSSFHYELLVCEKLMEVELIESGENLDIILSDMNLPDSKGLETIKSVIQLFPNTPTIVLTGNTDESEGIRSLELGAQDYLVKGRFDFRQIVKAIKFAISRKKMQAELELAKKKAEVANIHKNMFLANMSHEIRTPMNAVIGFAELLKEENLPVEEKNHFIDIINSSSKQLLNLIDDIIDVAKIEANELKIEESNCDLVSVLHDVKDTIDQIILRKGKKHINIHLDLPENISFETIRTDENRLQQVFINLINNAVKYARSEIVVGFREGNENISCYVKDDGIGIPKHLQAQIFERFSRIIDKNSIQSGTGLGLAICKGILEKLGGTIGVESEPGEGACFTFTLPKKFSDNSITPEQFIPIKTTRNIKELSLLVVDDEKDILEYFQAILSRSFEKVIYARSGKEAISVYQETPGIDIVLLDIRMPYMNGYEVMQKLLEINPDAIIIMQSAYVMPEDQEKCFELGGKDFIKKPIDRQLLLEKIEGLVG